MFTLTTAAVQDSCEDARTSEAEKAFVHLGSALADRTEPAPMLSVVVPFYNEEENVTELHARLHTVLDEVGWPYELVFVDDGSTDHTYTLLCRLAAVDPLVTVIRLRTNFGQTAALAAGFAQSSGEYVIAMDGDLQHINAMDAAARRAANWSESWTMTPPMCWPITSWALYISMKALWN
jgi:glycosyltransferase involved in cell wall biosynthesis